MSRHTSKNVQSDYTGALVTRSAPRSSAAEAYRMLRTNLLLSADREYHSLLVTSAGRNEGKSVTIANLGEVMASAGKRVAIVDADLRLPSQHRVFGVKLGSLGTAQLAAEGVTDTEQIAEAMVSVGDNLDVLPAGPTPDNPSEILGSPEFARFFEALCGMYDIVLVDTAPMGLVTDAAILSRAVDGVVFVVSYEESRHRFLQRAVGELRKVHANIVGTVLNQYPTKASSYGSGGYYGGYYYGGGYYGNNGNGNVAEMVAAEREPVSV